MPTTRPSDKGHDNAQWWKDESPEQREGSIPEGPTADDKQGAARNKFKEEQEPLQHPV